MEAFYKLTQEEWLRAIASLKPASIKILFYLRTSNPFGDKEEEYRIQDLGEKLALSRATVSRSLGELREAGWIDVEVTAVKIRVKKGLDATEGPQKCGPTASKMRPHGLKNEAPRPQKCGPTASKMRPHGLKNEAPLLRNEAPEAPKPATSAEPGSPQTNPDYSDFLDSLTHSERERFKNFVDLEVDRGINGQPIICRAAWIQKHWPNYWATYERKYSHLATPTNTTPQTIPPEVERAIAAGVIEKHDDRYLTQEGIWLMGEELGAWLNKSAEERTAAAEAYRDRLRKTREKLAQFTKGGSR